VGHGQSNARQRGYARGHQRAGNKRMGSHDDEVVEMNRG
jgi:hypothetical protein